MPSTTAANDASPSPDGRRAILAVHPSLDVVDAHVMAMAEDFALTYRAVVDQIVTGLSGSVFFVFDLPGGFDTVASRRPVFLAGERPDLARLLSARIGDWLKNEDIIIVIDEDTALSEPSREEFLLDVGRDLGQILPRLFPIATAGSRLEVMMPALTQLAAQVIMTPCHDKVAVRDRALQDAYLTLAGRVFVDRKAACETVVKRVPSWAACSQAVAGRAIQTAQVLPLPVPSMRNCAEEVHATIVSGLRDADARMDAEGVA